MVLWYLFDCFVGINYLPTHILDSLQNTTNYQRPTIIWTFWLRYTRKNLKTVWMKFNGKAGCKLVDDLAYGILSVYLHAKNQRNWYIASWDIDDQRILQSDWTIVFWPITCEPEIFRIWGLHKKTENCDVFHFCLLPAKRNNNTLWKV